MDYFYGTFCLLWIAIHFHGTENWCAWMFVPNICCISWKHNIRWGRNDMMVWQTLIFLEQTVARLSVPHPYSVESLNSTDCECWSDRCSGLYVFIGSVWCYRAGQWSVDACPCCSTLWNHYSHWPMSSKWRRREEAREAEFRKRLRLCSKTRAKIYKKRLLFNKDALHWSKWQ